MFEPLHGPAPDIAGKGVADPVVTSWTAAEILDWVGEYSAAIMLFEIVESANVGY